MPTNIFDMADTWNAGGTTFYAIRMNVTNAASAIGSRILDLATAGISQFQVDPSNGSLVGNPAGGLKGPGTLNAQGLYINGVLISGTVKVSGTPIGGQLAQWINADTLIGVNVSSLGYAPINNPVFTGDPQAPTPPPSDNDTSIATTAFVKTQLAAYQPLDDDLTSLAAATLNGTWYYRRSNGDWKPVIIGVGLAFDNASGDLRATAPPGMGDVTASDNPSANELALWIGPTTIKGITIGTGLSLDTVGTDQVLNATSAGGGGNVSSAGSPSGSQFAQWTDPTHIQGVPPANVLAIIGGQPAGNYQPLDGDLSSIAGASLTNSMYYRRLADTWDPVSIGTGLTFAGGVLASTGGTGTVKYTASTTQPVGAAAGDLWYDLTSGSLTIYVDDGNSSQWVQVSPAPGPDLSPYVSTAFVQAFTLGQKAQARQNIDAPGFPDLVPQCGRLAFVNGTQLSFKPVNGIRIKIDGRLYKIPIGGILGLTNISAFVNGVAGQTLAANTLYYVYAFLNGGVVTADYSLSGHEVSTSSENEGVEIKSGDDSRTLIGMVRTNASGQFQDSQANRLVASWFNRRARFLRGALSNNFSTTSSTNVELGGTASRVNFVSWADDDLIAGTNGGVFAPVAPIVLTFNAAVDGPSGMADVQSSITIDTNNNVMSGVSLGSVSISEGFHFLNMLGAVNVNGVVGTFQLQIIGLLRS